MSGTAVVRLAVEGVTDVAVARRLVELAGFACEERARREGKNRLDRKIPELNRSGKAINWLVLRDLDHDESCAPNLVRKVLKGQAMASRVSVRIAVRGVESWLLADHVGFSRHFSVRQTALPPHPDQLDNPKRELMRICGASRERDVRTSMMPRQAGGHRAGPGYANAIIGFASHHWEPERAARRSPSLNRALKNVRAMKAEGRWS